MNPKALFLSSPNARARARLRVLGNAGLVALAVVLTAGLAGCYEKVARIGVVVPLSGADAVYGDMIRRGLEVAAAELAEDSATGDRFVLEIVDSKSDPEHAARLTAELFERGAIGVIGGVTSDEAKSMLPVLERYDRVLLSPSAAAPELSGSSKNFYRIVPSGYAEAVKLADFAARTLGAKTAVQIAEARRFPRGVVEIFKPTFEGYGGRVLESLELPAAAPNAATEATAVVARQIVELDPEVIYLAAYEAASLALLGELERAGYDGEILTGRAFARPVAVAGAGEIAVGVYVAHAVPELDPGEARARRFVQAYRSDHGERPDLYAAYGYDALMVTAAALEDRPALPSELRKGLRDSIREYPGVTGYLEFNDRGDVTKYPRVYVVGEDLLLHEHAAWLAAKRRAVTERLERLEEQLVELADS